MPTEVLHPNLPPLPVRIKKLPVDKRGFPVPYFVEWFHADGKPFGRVDLPIVAGDYPDFRVVDSRKIALCYIRKKCWVCGDPLGRYFAFVIGPMCAINRVSSELPSHRDCALFSATACPFLTKPKVVRREDDLPEGYQPAAGVGLSRNPGVALVWVTQSYEAFRTEHREIEGAPAVAQAGVLYSIGDPTELLWFAEGRPATRAEIMASMDSGFPLLREAAMVDGPEGVLEVERAYKEALRLVPA